MNSRRNLYIFLAFAGLIAIVVVLANSDNKKFTFDITSSVDRKPIPSNTTNPYIPDDVEKNESMMDESSGYRIYSQADFEQSKDKTRVLFFYAPWCPDCRSADSQILNQLESIPENVVIYKTDYDKEKELKTKYGITYQHTFIIVDREGSAMNKWTGGSLREILENI